MGGGGSRGHEDPGRDRDWDHHGPRPSAPADAGEGRPAGSRERDCGRVRKASEAVYLEPSSLRAIGVGSPGAVDGRVGTVAHATCPAGGVYPLGPTLAKVLGPSCSSATTSTSRSRPSSAKSGPAVLVDHRRWWAPRRRDHPRRNRGSAAELLAIKYRVVGVNGRRCSWWPPGAWKRRPVEPRWRRTHGARRARREDRSVRDHEEEGRTRLSSSAGNGPFEKDDKLKVALIDRAIAARRRGCPSGNQSARRRSGRDRRRA